MLEKLTAENFEKHLHQTFTIDLGDEGKLAAELVEVLAMGSATSGKKGRAQAFSVLLRGPKDILLEQRMYRVEHPEMGAHDLFLVPVGPDDEGMCFEAVFY